MKQHKKDITAYTPEVTPDEAWITVKDWHRSMDKWQERYQNATDEAFTANQVIVEYQVRVVELEQRITELAQQVRIRGVMMETLWSYLGTADTPVEEFSQMVEWFDDNGKAL